MIPAPSGRYIPLLTELEPLFDLVFYNYAAPDGAFGLSLHPLEANLCGSSVNRILRQTFFNEAEEGIFHVEVFDY